MARHVVGMLLLATMAAGLIGCGTADDGSPRASGPTPASSAAVDPMATPAVDGRFPVGDEGRRLALRCWGSGSPTVVYGGGDSGIRDGSNGFCRVVLAGSALVAASGLALMGSDPR